LGNEYLKAWKGTDPETGKPIIDREIVEKVFGKSGRIIRAIERESAMRGFPSGKFPPMPKPEDFAVNPQGGKDNE
jgi:hypothetical protein